MNRFWFGHFVLKYEVNFGRFDEWNFIVFDPRLMYNSLVTENRLSDTARVPRLLSLCFFGGSLPEKKRYDLMELVLVCLGNSNSENKGNDLHGLLDTLFSAELAPQEKETILYNDYHIETTFEIEGGLREMCNLSDLIEEKGIEKGIQQGIEQGRLTTLISLVQDGLLPVEEAAKRAELTVEAFEKLLAN